MDFSVLENSRHSTEQRRQLLQFSRLTGDNSCFQSVRRDGQENLHLSSFSLVLRPFPTVFYINIPMKESSFFLEKFW